MARLKDFTLPDLGEGLTEGEILQWMVKVGDTVTLNQPIVEVETAKAAVEVPSPYAGLVTHIHHAAGETVDVGSPIITFDTSRPEEASLFGPVINRIPRGDEALELWDALLVIARTPGIAELKRSLRGAPVFT